MKAANEYFIKSLVKGAQVAQKNYGVPASVSIAQAILESGWGRSDLSTQACNLFGIKADNSWIGHKVTMPTTEYIHGQKCKVDAPFRKYHSFVESMVDHGLFLKHNPRYHAAFEHKDGPSFAIAIAKAGYATDPSYSNLLIALIHQHVLQQYDEA